MKPIRSTTVISIALCTLLLGGCSGCQLVRVDKLNQSVKRGDKQAILLAISDGVNINGEGMHAMKPLMWAAETGQVDICRLLLENGADPNGNNGYASVLMSAVISNNPEVVRVILDAGADKGWKNSEGTTAEALAERRGLTNMVPLVRLTDR